MITSNCATGTIDVYVPSTEKPWNKQRALHLYRRMGFGASPEQIEYALTQNPADLIDDIINEALELPLSPEPDWAFWAVEDYDTPDDPIEQQNEQLVAWIVQWMNDMMDNGFREKMTLFWHNHFVTKVDAYQCPSWMYQYHKILQEYALGDFKEFLSKIGTTPAMLVFLNGIQNTNFDPNENYARELYELFTLGQDNGYTQTDIEETARALTGWNGFTSLCAPVGFVSVLHDSGAKTIFGETGNWGYQDVHDLLFDHRSDEIATYICSKIYAHFVSHEVDVEIVASLAETFKANDFMIDPVLRQLFKSEHFFDRAIIGIQVKSPVDHFLTFIKEGALPYDDDVIYNFAVFCFLTGQFIFSPPDVSGWPGDRAWISSENLTGRWQGMAFYLFDVLFAQDPDRFRDLAITVTGSVSNDPEEVTRAIIDYFLPNGLATQEEYERAQAAFQWEIPQNYFDTGIWNLNWDEVPTQTAFLLWHLVRLPDFQLT